MNQFQSFGEVLSALRRRASIILAITFVGCMLSLYFALSQVKEYEATAVVQIEDARVPDQLAGATAQAEDSSRRVRLIEQRLMSRDNLLPIMQKHELFSNDPTVTIIERISMMRQAVRIDQIVNSAQPYSPSANVPSGLLITVRLSDPKKAADLANELMYSVIDQSRDRSIGRASDTLDLFATEEARVKADIEVLEQSIAEYKGQNSEALPEGVVDLRGQLVSLREVDLELAREILTLETSSARQREEVKDRQIQLLQENRLLIAERVAQIQAQLAAAPEVERELNNLERQLTQLQEQYTVITRRKAEAELGQMLEDRQQTDRFEVLETALEPEFPVSRSRKKTAVMGGVASLVLGVAVAFVIELMNPAIRTAAQMDRALGIQPVVSIPHVAARHTRTGRGLKIFAWIGAGAAALWGAIQLAGDKIPALGALFERFTQRTARG
ncbi:Wzz/FepE/Etk N-terminal domain-containing protein [uncultured Pelagimonas sp.]|uniref:GumC family protein n=1 Tax=uncultured Pelagimonas sp. TaxID=1618102 RepID=UPI002610140A|nr:Wzz/FepE/Etk N-terminal domain-containing protein [uncultured Pelagimonas sp.]